MVSRLRGNAVPDVPPYIAFDGVDPTPRSADYLGLAHRPFVPGEQLSSLGPSKGLTLDRLNDRKELLPVNMPNRGSILDFPDDLVVEVFGYFDKNGATPLAHGHMPPQVVGLVKMLGEYQALAAEAAWCGRRIDAIRALAANPLVMSLAKAEVIYDEMCAAHKDYLPERLLS